jgi:hypothetical protein
LLNDVSPLAKADRASPPPPVNAFELMESVRKVAEAKSSREK